MISWCAIALPQLRDVQRRSWVAFKRQFPIGNHIADFVAPSLKLAIEIDGAYHVNRAAADARKDRYLRRAGYRVLRIPAELVRTNLPEAVARIRAMVWRTGGRVARSRAQDFIPTAYRVSPPEPFSGLAASE